MSEPSSRILRRVIAEILAGTDGDQVERLVRDPYADSGYVMPRIKRRDERIHVSLLTQQAGDCTAAIFYLADGVVVNSEFSSD